MKRPRTQERHVQTGRVRPRQAIYTTWHPILTYTIADVDRYLLGVGVSVVGKLFDGPFH